MGAPPLPDYREPQVDNANAWPELDRARSESLTQIVLRDAADGTHVINAAAPVGLDGETLLITRNPIDITERVREARSTVALVTLLALFVSTMLSLFLAQTIVRPLRELVQAAVRVRQGRDRQVEVPRLPDRRDEIGMLARAISDMTHALRMRIDAVMCAASIGSSPKSAKPAGSTPSCRAPPSRRSISPVWSPTSSDRARIARKTKGATSSSMLQPARQFGVVLAP